jgi:transcriptional regulator with XRE-family HTH domain
MLKAKFFIMSDFKFIEERKKMIPDETKVFVKMSLDILERIHEIMESRRLTYKDLATALDKDQSEISKWINGSQNFTIKTLAKLQVALKEEIITIPCARNRYSEFQKIQRIVRQRPFLIERAKAQIKTAKRQQWIAFTDLAKSYNAIQQIDVDLNEPVVVYRQDKGRQINWQHIDTSYGNQAKEETSKDIKPTFHEAI